MNITPQQLEICPILYDGQLTRIYYQEQSEYGGPALVKVLKAEYPTPRQVVRFFNEVTLTRDLNIPGIRKTYAYGTIGKRHALALQYIDGQPLKTAMQTSSWGMTEKLRIAVSTAQALSAVHQRNIIHKDINSRNILVSREDVTTHIIDFGIASQVDIKTYHLGNPETLEGTLQYISPEQTGRMNRIVDYRTDLYSLGVTLYELFTGQLPFQTADVMELVYCHIAKRPVPPYDVGETHGRASLPRVISDIIMKLLEKNAEDRYQSAYGVKIDLEKCLKKLTADGLSEEKKAIEPFLLAQDDISGRFQIPQKLYGREQELRTLIEAFERISRTSASEASSQVPTMRSASELLLISGYSGVGKSSLVHEIYKPITAKRGYFVTGKFDQYQRNVPYYALRQAFDEFAAYVLTESDERLQEWKTAILKAVGNNGQALIDIAPKLQLVLGEQPALAEVGPQEAQNRFHMVLQNFVRAIARPLHPLTLFLDDLQWADAASLQLLHALLTDPDIRHCLIIGAYRDNEVDASHPLTIVLDALRKAEAGIGVIHLENLSHTDVNTLILETLSCDAAYARPLTKLIYQKTHGNAFFTIRLFQSLFEEELIAFDYERRQWTWSAEEIKSKGVTDNVADLMKDKLGKLFPDTLEALKLAACIGNQFELGMLAAISGQTPENTLERLWEGLQENLIVPVDESYKLVRIGKTHALFQFLHDRVQQGAYALMNDADRIGIHRQIGQLLVAQTPEDVLDTRVFEIAHHFNLARDVLDERETTQAIELNLQAGRRAKASAAYAAASEFFENGVALLSKSPWETAYDTTLALYSEWAESAYLARQYEEAERLFAITLEHTADVLDRCRVHELQVDYYTTQMQFEQAVDIARQALAQLGNPLPGNPTQEVIGERIQRTMELVGSKSLEELRQLPELTDPVKTAVMSMLIKSTSAIYNGVPAYFPIIVTEMVNISLKYGNSPMTPWGYMTYAIIMAGVIGDIGEARKFDRLAIELADRYAMPIVQGKLYHVHTWFALWNGPLRDNLPIFRQGMRYAEEAGDFAYLAYLYLHYCFTRFYTGEPLSELKELFERYTPRIYRTKVIQNEAYFTLYQQTVLNLLGEAADPVLLQGAVFDETESLPHFRETNDLSAICYYGANKGLLCYLTGAYQEGYNCVRDTEPFLSGILCQPPTQPYYLVYGLLASALYAQAEPEDQAGYLDKLRAIHGIFKPWGEESPHNYRHKYDLLSAELARAEGNHIEAMTLYDRAIQGAQNNGFLQEEAMANECAAEFYLSRGLEKIARVYMQEAYYAYQKWGANVKLELLKQRYSRWFVKSASTTSLYAAPDESTIITTTMPTGAGAALLDVGTMIKASQALSREVRLEQVLQRLMELVVENAGAQNGVLLLKEDDQWHLQAQVAPEHDVRVLQGIPLNILVGDPSRPLSVAIVEYAVRTGESVVLPDAARDERFGRDHYVQRKQPKSVLCQPIRHKGALTGILYLENNLSTNAFTPDRLELLNILCSQAAISLENARLVENMREQERLQKEMELARQIQTAILPKHIEHPDFEIEAVMLPAEEVGGDYYDGLIGKDGNLWLGIGDVSGHGMTSGLIMMMAQTIHATITIQTDVTPRDAIVNLNDMLYRNVRERLDSDHFMTFTTLRYLGEGRFQHAGAHLDLLVYRKAAGICERIETDGAWLNFIPNISHATENAEFTVEIGDTLVLYTDGLTEAHAPGEEILDIQRFREIVRHRADLSPAAMRDAILHDVLEWSKQHRADDMSLLIVRRVR